MLHIIDFNAPSSNAMSGKNADLYYYADIFDDAEANVSMAIERLPWSQVRNCAYHCQNLTINGLGSFPTLRACRFPVVETDFSLVDAALIIRRLYFKYDNQISVTALVELFVCSTTGYQAVKRLVNSGLLTTYRNEPLALDQIKSKVRSGGAITIACNYHGYPTPCAGLHISYNNRVLIFMNGIAQGTLTAPYFLVEKHPRLVKTNSFGLHSLLGTPNSGVPMASIWYDIRNKGYYDTGRE